jgi:hypothetical protein
VVFTLGAAVVGCAVLGLYLWLTSAEWFLGDDFAFLSRAQRPWSWSEVFFPLERGFWWAYRPLGMDAFFRLGFQLFGWNAGGFFAVAVGVRALTGLVAYRLARQLGFDFPAAVVAALLGVSRFPSISNAAHACAFHYTAALFFQLLALSLFLDVLRGRGRTFQLGGALCFVAGLLCNELVLSLPLLLLLAALGVGDGRRLSLERLRGALLACWPYFALAAAFLVFRYGLIAPVEPPSLYTLHVSWKIGLNALIHLRYVAGSGGHLLAALGGMAGMAVALSKARGADRGIWAPVARVWVLGLAWLLGVLLPLSALPFAHPRFAAPAEIPVALLFAVLIDAVWKAFPGRRPRLLLQVALPALLLASLPWSEVRQRADQARGPYLRAMQQEVARSFPDLRGRHVIKILYGGEGRADVHTAERLRFESYGGVAFAALYPGEPIAVVFEDVTTARRELPLCENCHYLELLPDHRLAVVSAASLGPVTGSGPARPVRAR